MIEPKLCPFCGGSANVIKNKTMNMKFYYVVPYYFVMCSQCRAQSHKFETDEEAIEAWNKRARLTSELEPPKSGTRRCKHCGAFVSTRAVSDCFGVIPTRYCPNCGIEVIN